MADTQNPTPNADAAERAYRMKTSGGTVGAVTGKNRVWRAGQVVVAPEGEFAHLGDRHCEALDAAELKRQQAEQAEQVETATAPPAPEKAVAPPAETGGKAPRRKK